MNDYKQIQWTIYNKSAAFCLMISSMSTNGLETWTRGFETGTIDLKMASFTLLTCSSNNLTFIFKSEFLSRSTSSCLSKVPNLIFLFCLQRLDAMLFRSRMRRYFWSPEAETPEGLNDDASESMLKLDETLRLLKKTSSGLFTKKMFK